MNKMIKNIIQCLFMALIITSCVDSISKDDITLSCSVLNDDSASSDYLYYYYQNEKVFLELNADECYVARYSDVQSEPEAIMTGQNTFSIHNLKTTSEESQNNLLMHKERIVENTLKTKLMSKDENVLLKLRKIKKEDADIKYISPCFKMSNGKEFSASPFVYVKLKASKDSSLLKNVAKNLQLTNIRSVPYMPLWYQLSCVKNSDKCSVEIANELYETGFFSSAEPGFIGNLYCSSDYNDTYFSDQWGLENTGQYNGIEGIDIKAVQAHSVSTGLDVKVAVIDCGIDYSHKDLSISSKSFDAYKNIEYTNQSVIYEKSAHGTCCAGIIGAYGKNAKGICGVAPRCKLISVSLPVNQSDDFVFVNALNWAVNNGADIINCSWGGEKTSSLLTEAIKRAVKNGRNGLGCVVVCATGNDDKNKISYPSLLDEVISVGAMDMFGKRKTKNCVYENSWGSNYGTGLDCVAPGIFISSTDLTGTMGYNGGNTYQQNLGQWDYSDGDFTKIFNGTSAATPFVSGIAALILEKDKTLTASAVKSIIRKTCTKLPIYFGANAVQTADGSWNNEVGYGLVNAFSAVSKVIMGDNKYCISGQETLTDNSWNVYEIKDLPRGLFVSWSVSDTKNFSVSRSGYNSANLKANASGKSTLLTATIESRTEKIGTVSMVVNSVFK